jgi:hypothetical protein
MLANKTCFVGLTPIELLQATWRGAAKRLHGDGRRFDGDATGPRQTRPSASPIGCEDGCLKPGLNPELWHCTK